MTTNSGKLIHPKTGEVHTFTPGHADKIMAMHDNGGWAWAPTKGDVSDDSTDQGAGEKPQEQKASSRGKGASK